QQLDLRANAILGLQVALQGFLHANAVSAAHGIVRPFGSTIRPRENRGQMTEKTVACRSIISSANDFYYPLSSVLCPLIRQLGEPGFLPSVLCPLSSGCVLSAGDTRSGSN